MAKTEKNKVPRQSIVRDVEQSLLAINKIGHSKFQFRKDKNGGMIHSKKQMKHDFSACMLFVKWVKAELGVKRLYDLKLEHVQAYLSHKKSEGVGIGHLRNIETSLVHLQRGSEAYFKSFDYKVDRFMPEGRITPSEGVKKPVDRSYTEKEYRAVLENSSENVRNAVKLMRTLGLRIDEAVKIRVDHFIIKNSGDWHLKIKQGESVTKGGRFRDVPVPDQFRSVLQQMIEGKEYGDRLVPVQQTTVRNGINRALKKCGFETLNRGAHGFRHMYARDRLSEEFQNRGIEEKGSAMLERCFYNRERGKLSNYGIFRPEDQQLYKEVKAVVDKVHSELGHGKDRWDLAEVYMR